MQMRILLKQNQNLGIFIEQNNVKEWEWTNLKVEGFSVEIARGRAAVETEDNFLLL